MRRRGIWVFGLLLWTSTVAAQEGDDERARAHFVSGRAYFDQARYEDAAREFEEAYRLSPRSELLENASRSYERALQFDQAIDALQRLLRNHPDSGDQATYRERIANLERLRDRLHSGGGGGAEPSGPTGPSGGGGGGSISVPGLALVITGGVLGLGSLFFGIGSQAMYDSVSAACPDGLCPANRSGDVGTGQALAWTSTILMFAAPVALAIGIVLLVIDQGGSSARAGVRLLPGPGDAGLNLQVRL